MSKPKHTNILDLLVQWFGTAPKMFLPNGYWSNGTKLNNRKQIKFKEYLTIPDCVKDVYKGTTLQSKIDPLIFEESEGYENV